MRITCPRLKYVRRKDNKHGRVYTIGLKEPDEEVVRPSVTTRLNIIHSEHLVGWRIKRAESIHKEAALELAGMEAMAFAMAYDAKVKEVRERYETDSPSSIGDNVHAMIEAFCKKTKPVEPATEEAFIAFKKFEHWAKVNDFEPWGSELPLWNGTAAGTMDLIGLVRGELYTLDTKTGGMYPEYDLQIAKYSDMVLNMFKSGLLQLAPGDLFPLKGGIILKLPKTQTADPVERIRTRVEMAEDAARFDSATALDEWARTHGRGPLEVAVY